MAVAAIFLQVSAAAAEPGAASPNFAIVHHEIATGGGLSSSGRFEIISSINTTVTAGLANSASFTHRQGYIGQLNELPSLQPDHFIARPGRPLKVLKANLLANDTDADDALLRFINVSPTSANGVPSALFGDWVLYDFPIPNASADSFTYTVTDGIDQSIGTVALTVSASGEITLNISLLRQGPDNLLRIFGIPGRNYQIQTAASLAAPITWSNLGPPATAPANGLMQRLDGAPPTTRFYRAIEP